MNNLPLQPLVWKGAAMANITHFEAQGAGIFYRINKIDGNHIVVWHDQSEGSSGSKELKNLEEAKNWAEFTHYPSKMQPYVKPAPTKVYELAFDCDESYFTVFMTTDKQAALDVMESVKDADQDFISSYGFDDDADELLIEQYDDNHPLKPYASKIFEPIYEDSFSEWAISYAGNSLVSQMSIIEHELFSTMQNNKGE